MICSFLEYNLEEKKMQVDMKQNPYQKHWWDGQVIRLVIYISRNDLVWVGLCIILVVLYFKFLPNWDWIFGFR